MIIEHPGIEELIGESLIYEHVNGVVYARFRDEPKKSLYAGMWLIGGNANSVSLASGYLGYDAWKELFSLADKHPTLRKQLDKTLTLYYILKSGEFK